MHFPCDSTHITDDSVKPSLQKVALSSTTTITTNTGAYGTSICWGNARAGYKEARMKEEETTRNVFFLSAVPFLLGPSFSSL